MGNFFFFKNKEFFSSAIITMNGKEVYIEMVFINVEEELGEEEEVEEEKEEEVTVYATK